MDQQQYGQVLSCIVCDIPATRKVCGFWKNALKGCSKCLKEFPTARFGAKPDYSGFDCENWPVRKLSEHKKHVSEVKQAKTSTKRSEKESLHGVRYSELLRLPYFYVIRLHVVDPMHNLFLGLAKHTMSTWKELNILNEADFQTLQAKVDALVPPPKIGRIPHKIASGFYSFTADEWKNWVLVYSLYSLVDVLPTHDYQCWCLFVDACRLLCQLVITEQEILAAHGLITKFCKKFEELYGPQHCTPNMHLACHIKSCMLDYGRIPRKIASLVDVLPTHDYQCWCLFVDACRLLCQLVITEQEILAAHGLITKFCKKFEELYAPGPVTLKVAC